VHFWNAALHIHLSEIKWCVIWIYSVVRCNFIFLVEIAANDIQWYMASLYASESVCDLCFDTWATAVLGYATTTCELVLLLQLLSLCIAPLSVCWLFIGWLSSITTVWFIHNKYLQFDISLYIFILVCREMLPMIKLLGEFNISKFSSSWCLQFAKKNIYKF